ncbi:hypothetical protein [Pelagicoccus sp. SDUM812005]|uniref:hypothetical protein n=1 Tax=Pelagicoccus sp. SDUM812005 TaxID=3041257 RepID=UPI00280F42AC|nr:hypothetical protein [Pelagicoccus sp. SDUM812005]MDQ8182721.1 hypothetical protein [Pelagicoccus sp. SDUM812005]
MKYIPLYLLSFILIGCTTVTEYYETTISLTVRDQTTKKPLKNITVYFVHHDPFGANHRFGPFSTDSKGQAHIEIPSRTIKNKGISFSEDRYEFEFLRDGLRKAVVRNYDPDSGLDPEMQIENIKQRVPNKAVDTTAANARLFDDDTSRRSTNPDAEATT